MTPPLRVLFLTLEFSAATFSGNGVYAQSQVRALAQLGHPVLVICACPEQHDQATTQKHGAADVLQILVSQWGRLDASAPYQEFAEHGSTDEVAQAVANFRPDVAMAVDWSALPLYQALGTKLKQQQQQQPAAVLPMVWLNYRVFSRTSTGAELELVSRLERQAMHEAVLSVALSRSDAAYLDQHVASQQAMPSGTAEGEGRCPSTQAAKRVHVLLPALREDMRLMDAPVLLGLNGSCNGTDQGTVAHGVGNRASQSSQDMGDGHCGATAPTTSEVQAFVQSRPYLTCCVRLSSEKEPQRFVELMEELAARGALGTDGPGGLGVTPLLIGSATDEYAQGLKARLKAAAPGAVLVEKFMGPADLVEVYRSTRLNIHPPTYDAYGMTIVEAASQGAPSLVHGGSGYAGGDGTGAVGATDLLRGSHDEVILLDLSTDVAIVAEAVQTILSDPVRLLRVAAAAEAKARSWTEAANAAELINLTRKALELLGQH